MNQDTGILNLLKVKEQEKVKLMKKLSKDLEQI